MLKLALVLIAAALGGHNRIVEMPKVLMLIEGSHAMQSRVALMRFARVLQIESVVLAGVYCRRGSRFESFTGDFFLTENFLPVHADGGVCAAASCLVESSPALALPSFTGSAARRVFLLRHDALDRGGAPCIRVAKSRSRTKLGRSKPMLDTRRHTCLRIRRGRSGSRDRLTALPCFAIAYPPARYSTVRLDNAYRPRSEKSVGSASLAFLMS